MPRTPTPAAKDYRKRVALPGLLEYALGYRWKIFGYPGLSPYLLELICCDLRFRCPHDITLLIAQRPLHIQHAIDSELCRQQRPSAEKNGPLVQALNGTRLPPVNRAP